jgi:hypothetical protein
MSDTRVMTLPQFKHIFTNNAIVFEDFDPDLFAAIAEHENQDNLLVGNIRVTVDYPSIADAVHTGESCISRKFVGVIPMQMFNKLPTLVSYASEVVIGMLSDIFLTKGE